MGHFGVTFSDGVSKDQRLTRKSKEKDDTGAPSPFWPGSSGFSRILKLMVTMGNGQIVILVVLMVLWSFSKGERETSFKYLEFLVFVLVWIGSSTFFQVSKDDYLSYLKRVNKHEVEAFQARFESRLGELRKSEIVPGDILNFHSGQIVPCDGVCIEFDEETIIKHPKSTNPDLLSTYEASLIEHQKFPDSPASFMLFQGSEVISGNCWIVCLRIQRTPIKVLNQKPIQIELVSLKGQETIRKYSYLLGLGIYFLRINLLLFYSFKGYLAYNTSVNLNASKQPKDLPFEMFSLLFEWTSIDWLFLSRHLSLSGLLTRLMIEVFQNLNGLQVKSRDDGLSLVALGRATSVVFDKTGVLQSSERQVVSIWNSMYFYGEGSVGDMKRPYLKALNTLLASIVTVESESSSIFNAYASYLQENAKELLESSNGLPEVLDYSSSFSSDRTLSLLVKFNASINVIVQIAPPPDILPMMSTINFLAHPYEVTPVNEQTIEKIMEVYTEQTKKGREVQMIGIRVVSSSVQKLSFAEFLRPLTFFGFLMLGKPEKSYVKDMMSVLVREGVSVKIISGDDLVNVENLSKSIEFVNELDDPKGVIGEAENALKSESFESFKAFGKATKENKATLVRKLKEKGETVVYVGDADNDSHALDESDTGVVMGVDGTDNAKKSSHLIIADGKAAKLADLLSVGKTHLELLDTITKISFTTRACLVTGLILLPFFLEDPLFTKKHMIYLMLVLEALPAVCIALKEPKTIWFYDFNSKTSVLIPNGTPHFPLFF